MKITITNDAHQGKLIDSNSPSSDIKEVFDKILTDLKKDNSFEAKWVNDSEVVLNNLPASELHTFVLQAEQLGKTISYFKQTTIQIND